MTLITATNVEPGFAIMTSDTRMIYEEHWYDTNTNEYTDEKGEFLEVSEEKIIKVRYLSRFAMIGAGGVSDLCRYISKRMAEIIKMDDDLAACEKKLTKLIRKMRSHPKPPRFFSFLNKENGVGVILNGFNRNGESGMVFFVSGPSAEVTIRMTPTDCTQYSMIPPEKVYIKHARQLSKDVTNGTEAYEAAVSLHAKISLQEQIKVSPDCHYFILARDNSGQIKRVQGDFDTSLLYEQVKNSPLT